MFYASFQHNPINLIFKCVLCIYSVFTIYCEKWMNSCEYPELFHRHKGQNRGTPILAAAGLTTKMKVTVTMPSEWPENNRTGCVSAWLTGKMSLTSPWSNLPQSWRQTKTEQGGVLASRREQMLTSLVNQQKHTMSRSFLVFYTIYDDDFEKQKCEHICKLHWYSYL